LKAKLSTSPRWTRKNRTTLFDCAPGVTLLACGVLAVPKKDRTPRFQTTLEGARVCAIDDRLCTVLKAGLNQKTLNPRKKCCTYEGFRK
jgi:hypothetical protein